MKDFARERDAMVATGMRTARHLGCWAAVLVALGCSTPIRHGMDESAANEVVSALEHAGIGARKLRDDASGGTTFIVEVSDGDTLRALEVLEARGLPRGRRAGFAEMYAQPSLVPTATEERARYMQALSGEIERTLETMDGVVSARVHLVMAEVDPLTVDTKPSVPAQAAVLLKTRGGAGIKDTDVKKLVAGSVPGLGPATVAVVVTEATETAAAGKTAPSRFRLAGGRPVFVLLVVLGVSALATLALLLLFTTRKLAALQRQIAPPS